MRCTRCGHDTTAEAKFCGECGMFLRDPWVDHRVMLALRLEREGKHLEARRELEQLMRTEPDHILGNHLLGTMYFHQGMLDDAIGRYQKALDLAPRFVLCAYDLGVAWFHRGNMAEAIPAFRKCLEIDPQYNAAHYRLGICLFHAGELDEALAHFEKASLLTPEYLMARYHIGVIHERRGNLEAAAREFERAIEDGVGEASSLWHLERLRGEGVET